MKDVARLAGVSVSTVSRVMSAKIPVDKGTEEKVRAAIRKLDYRPNLLASGLRMKSGKSVGFIVPELSDPYFAVLIEQVELSVSMRGYDLHLGNTHSSPDTEKRLIDSFVRRHVDGIIFSRVSDESRVMEHLSASDVPMALIDRVGRHEEVLSVVLDNCRAGELAAAHFVSKGHSRIACVTGPLNILLSRERLKGFREGLSKAGIDLDESLVFEGDYGFRSGMAAARRFFSRGDVTAIWAQNDMMAAGVLKVAAELGVRVPHEVAVMGLDDIGLCEIVHPSLTTVAQPYDRLASTAVDMVLSHDDYASLASRRVVLEPTLVVRAST